MFGGVVGHQPLVCRCLKGLVEDGVDTVDSGGREAEALAGTGDDPPLFQKEAVQFPQVLCGKLREPLLSQAGLDVAGHITPVPFQGAGPQGERRLLQPAVQPLCQRHSALFRQVHSLIGVDVLPEFGGQFFLGICVDISEDGVAIALVADDDSALPTAIFPFPNHAVAGWSSLCHAAHLQSLSLICGAISE